MTLIKQQPSCLKYKNDFSNLRVPDIIRVYHTSVSQIKCEYLSNKRV